MIMLSLMKRHIRLYVRDKWAVFFSFLSVFIILGLFMLFLQNSLSPDPNANVVHFDYMISSWLMAGVLMVSTVTVPLGFLALMVIDLENKTINDFYVSPIKRYVIVLSYLFAAMAITSVFALLNLLIGQLYLYLTYGFLLSFASFIKVVLVMLLSSALFSSLFFYIVSFLKTGNAVGTLSTLVGTLIGFLAGLYVPIGALTNTVVNNVLSALPTLQMAALFRHVYMQEALNKTFGDNVDYRQGVELFIGVRIEILDTPIGFYGLLACIFAWIALFTGLSMVKIAKYKIKR